MSSTLHHLRAAAAELAQAQAQLQTAATISAEEWPQVAAALLAIQRQLKTIDLRLEGKG